MFAENATTKFKKTNHGGIKIKFGVQEMPIPNSRNSKMGVQLLLLVCRKCHYLIQETE